MTKCCASEIPIKKDGILYETIKPNLKPLDLLLFKGADFIGKAITFLQRSRFKNTLVDFTHAGMVVTKEILDDDLLEEGKLYILESVLSGKLAQGVYNIRGKGYIGVQLRDLDEVIETYDRSNGTRIAHYQLQNNPYNDISKHDYLKSQFTTLFKKYDGIKYDFNFVSLLSSIYPMFRCMRSQIEHYLHTEEWLFCSELCAL